jgi:SNF2 family DNA or RNA helicase
MLSRNDLHEYQCRTVDFIKSKRRCGLALEMGLGKSVSTLTAMADLLDGCIVDRVLVIAPLRVANSVWAQEVKKWAHLQRLKVVVCTGTERQRLTSLQKTADVYVINRENVPWLVEHYAKGWPFDVVIIDESSSFKSQAAQRWKAIRRVLPMTDYMVLLTGTPAPNSLLDLWAQQYLIDQGAALGKTLTAYKQRFFDADFMGYKFSPKAGAAEKIHTLLTDSWISMAASDYLQLPERINLVEPVYLPPATLKAYLNFERTLLAELPDGQEIEASSAAVLANKLLQWCNGAMYIDDKNNWSALHDAKLDALAEIMEDNPNETVLIAYNYKSDLARIQQRFPDAVVLDKEPSTIARWNAGEIRMLLAHPASAGHGLNLQDGGALCVWFGLNWSLELYQQFNARLHRQGQIRPVRIVHLVTSGGIDERVITVLHQKDAQQNALLDALRP